MSAESSPASNVRMQHFMSDWQHHRYLVPLSFLELTNAQLKQCHHIFLKRWKYSDKPEAVLTFN